MFTVCIFTTFCCYLKKLISEKFEKLVEIDCLYIIGAHGTDFK